MKTLDYKLVVFDLDGTLTNEKSSWYYLARHFGAYEESSKNMKSYLSGGITYVEFMRRDISAWGRNVLVSEVKRTLDKIEPRKDAAAVVKYLRSKYSLLIVTTALDILATRVGREVGIDRVLCNSAITEKNGRLTGDVVARVNLLEKRQIVRDTAKELGLPTNACVSIGDSIHDLGMLQESGLGIAIQPDHDLSSHGFTTIEELSELTMLL